MPSVPELEKIPSERVTIKPFEPEKDGYVFLHGIAFASFKGKMYCVWAHNKIQENSGEEVNYAVSDDGGKSWSKFILGSFAPKKDIAVSHGAFLVHNEALYFLLRNLRVS